jgi:HTH-type transcriptional regulator, transcriptional repressor of NAD biosynthesis genes
MEKKIRSLRVAVTGPECSGKTSLTERLKQIFGTDIKVLSEPAPAYLYGLNRSYIQEDVNCIYRIQKAELLAALEDASLLISDTEFCNLLFWSRYRFGVVDKGLLESCREPAFDLYLLMYPDLEWEIAPFRENPDDRLLLFWAYCEWFEAHGFPYRIIRGMGDERVERALEQIQLLMEE